MRTSGELSEVAAALAKAQGAMRNAPKDSDNPYFKSKYADLATCWDTIRKPLADNGLSVTQTAGMDDNRLTVTTLLLHCSGQWIEGTMSTLPKEYTPQALGSALTYLRRYSLSAIVGLASEDDDGAAASGTVKAEAVPRRPPGTVSAKEPPHEKVKQEKLAALEQAGKDAFQPGDPLPIDDRREDFRHAHGKRSEMFAFIANIHNPSDAGKARAAIVEYMAQGLLTEQDATDGEKSIVERLAFIAGGTTGDKVKRPKKKEVAAV